jgi:hypothetical protein
VLNYTSSQNFYIEEEDKQVENMSLVSQNQKVSQTEKDMEDLASLMGHDYHHQKIKNEDDLLEHPDGSIQRQSSLLTESLSHFSNLPKKKPSAPTMMGTVVMVEKLLANFEVTNDEEIDNWNMQDEEQDFL